MTLPCRMDEGDWRPEMAWAVPRFSKKKVNWAGRAIALPAPEVNHELDEYQAWMYEYYDALDIVNNWRSSHNFPLNTFHVGLKRRAKAVDQTAITAQRIKRMASIELKLSRFPTMTLSQMQDVGGCRAIVSSAAAVEQLCDNYANSEIKHTLHQKDDYIKSPKDSGYRGVHLVYRYFSDKKQDYNTLKIEMQLRSQLQHAWATAVETVGAFVQQALKSSLGEQEWLRFFALMGAAIAVRENTPQVPGTPENYSDLVKELRDHATSLEVSNRLRAFGAALRFYEGAQSKTNHYYLIEVSNSQKTVTVTGFKQSESEKATAKYLEVEKKIKEVPSADAVLVSVDSMDSLRRAYPNYFLDTGIFVSLLEEILAPAKRVIATGRIRTTK
jgi:ppGpp synthetase/RelA/SpoT-type nucleotidyltranferase